MSASTHDEALPRLTWRDVLAYLLAYALWIIVSLATGVIALLMRSAITPPIALILLRNPYYFTHSTELRGVVTSLDRAALIALAIIWIVYIIWLEEWLRSSIQQTRQRRWRAVLSAGDQPLIETGLQRWNLDLLVRRAGVALIFPAALIGLYLILQGVIRLLAR